MGRFPTHLDTHHHVGRHDPILDLVLDFARPLKVPVRSQDAVVRAAARRLGLRTPDHFMELVDVLHQAGVGVILDWVPSHFPSDEHGLGYFDEDLAYSRYGRQRETELAGLTDAECRRAVERDGIQLAHFGTC